MPFAEKAAGRGPTSWHMACILRGEVHGEWVNDVRRIVAKLAGLAVLWLLAPAGALAVPAVPPEAMCATEAARFEHGYDIPARLLDAISIVESGRWDQGHRASVAWPWTINANGEGKFFPTKAEAIAEVRRLRAAGVKSIDVGCMQVNLQYHPDAFTNLDDAFDPTINVAYAARFLKGLYQATGHWPTAASYYHSQTPKLAAEYRDKLMKVWTGPARTAVAAVAAAVPPVAAPRPGRAPVAVDGDEPRRIADAYRQARMAEYQLRRARMIEHRRVAARS